VRQIYFKKPMRLGVLLGVVVLLAIGTTPIDHAAPVTAQEGQTCPVLVDQALQIVGTSCSAVGLNEACYGHTLVSATFREGAAGVPFAFSGDRAQLVDLEALVTQPANPATGDWGIAMMKVQAEAVTGGSIPVTMILFGEATIFGLTPGGAAGCTLQTRTGNVNIRSGPGTGFGVIDILGPGMTAIATGHNISGGWVRVDFNGTVGWMWEPAVVVDCPVESLPAVDARDTTVAARPMSAFNLENNDASACEDAPNGMLIRSPGGERARVVVNGVQLEFASAAFLTAQPDHSMMIIGLEGEIDVTAFGQTVTLTPGVETGIPLVGLEASGPPMPPRVVDINPSFPRLLNETVPDAIVRNDVINVRTQPGEGAPILTSVPRDTPLALTGRLPDNSWVRVRVPDGREGWVLAALLEINIDLNTVPVINAEIIRPPNPPTFTPVPIPTQPPLPTATVPPPPMSVSFYADLTCVDPQNPCTTLYWSVEGIREVYYQGAGVVGSGAQQECPTSPTTYTLTVTTVTGEQLSYSVFVNYDRYSCYEVVTEEPPEIY
jgi:uncharacterized protein YraI